jgi:hypothetical protein
LILFLRSRKQVEIHDASLSNLPALHGTVPHLVGGMRNRPNRRAKQFARQILQSKQNLFQRNGIYREVRRALLGEGQALQLVQQRQHRDGRLHHFRRHHVVRKTRKSQHFRELFARREQLLQSRRFSANKPMRKMTDLTLKTKTKTFFFF